MNRRSLGGLDEDRSFPGSSLGDISHPNITVVIPCFNMAETLARAVESVLSQLGSDDRLIVVDDGSTDATLLVLEGLEHHALQIVKQRRKGVSAARNVGSSLATTNFVAFLDADDFWFPGALECLKALISSYPGRALYSFGHSRLYPGEVENPPPTFLEHAHEVFSGSEFVRKYSTQDLINSSSVCVSKRKLEAIGGFPENVSVGEDVTVWLKLSLDGEAAVCRVKHGVIVRSEARYRKRRTDVPFYFTFIDSALRSGNLDLRQRKAFRQFLVKRGLRVFLGARILDEAELARNVRDLVLRNRRRVRPLFWLGHIIQLPLLHRLYRFNRLRK